MVITKLLTNYVSQLTTKYKHCGLIGIMFMWRVGGTKIVFKPGGLSVRAAPYLYVLIFFCINIMCHWRLHGPFRKWLRDRRYEPRFCSTTGDGLRFCFLLGHSVNWTCQIWKSVRCALLSLKKFSWLLYMNWNRCIMNFT